MIAFDTNLLVRLAVNDDEEQAEIAENLLAKNEVFISRTVLLETEWVLRSVYKNSREEIALYFEAVLITENVTVENAIEANHALNWYKLGADFADAMHLCICGESILHTFDEYAFEHGAPASGSSGAQGDAPKLLLTQKKQ